MLDVDMCLFSSQRNGMKHGGSVVNLCHWHGGVICCSFLFGLNIEAD